MYFEFALLVPRGMLCFWCVKDISFLLFPATQHIVESRAKALFRTLAVDPLRTPTKKKLFYLHIRISNKMTKTIIKITPTEDKNILKTKVTPSKI